MTDTTAGEHGVQSWRRGRALVGTIGFAVSIGYLLQAFALPFGTQAQPGAAVFPVLVGFAFALVSLMTIAEAFMLRTEVKTLELPKGKDARRLLLIALTFVGYIVLLPILGHLVASILFGLLSVRILGDKSWRFSLITGAAIGVVVYAAFVLLLSVPMPGFLDI